MTAKFGFKNGGWKFTDNYDKELAFFGQNNVNRLNGIDMPMGDFMMPPGHAYGNKRYFVDPTNGSDSNNGLTWRTAFATFEKGIDMCRFVQDTTTISYTDKSVRAFLFLAPGHYNETTQLLFSGYNISVIGCGIGVPGKDYGVSMNYDGTSAATAAFLLSGSGIEIHNIHIYCDAAIPALYIAGGDNNLIRNCVIECDGTNCTYGILADSMKGSRIENVYISNAKTAGIYVQGGADHYAIHGHIAGCSIWGNINSAKGIYVDGNNTVYNFWIDGNRIQLSGGTSVIGISCEANAMVVNNLVSVPTSADAIYHTGGEQYQIHNHTTAGVTGVDPDPAAG